MDLNKMIQAMKRDPDYSKMGMIASHLGVVRGTSLNGKKVLGVDVSFDKKSLDRIIGEINQMAGIIKVMIDVCGGRLGVGDEIMAVAVGGDTREHVFPALMAAVDRVKSEATTKRELF